MAHKYSNRRVNAVVSNLRSATVEEVMQIVAALKSHHPNLLWALNTFSEQMTDHTVDRTLSGVVGDEDLVINDYPREVKIRLIKELREVFGFGLKEAKLMSEDLPLKVKRYMDRVHRQTVSKHELMLMESKARALGILTFWE